MGSRYRTKVLLTALAMAVVTAMPGIAQAETESKEEETTSTTAPEVQVPPVTQVTSVLPVLGSGLTVSLTRDGTGTITEVALDPSGATIVKEGEHKVVFLLADGDTQVVVKSYSKDKGDDEATAGGVKTTVTADARFQSVVTVGDQTVTTIQGVVDGESVAASITAGTSEVSYVRTPDGEWVTGADEEWSALEGEAPGAPLAGLIDASDLAMESADSDLVVILATLGPAAGPAAGTEVAITVSGG